MKWKKHYGGELRWARRTLIKRDGNICSLCKEPMANMKEVTIDHIQALANGGTDRIDNLRLVHETCNRERGTGFFGRSSPSEGQGDDT